MSTINLEQTFGEYVFDDEAMRQWLPEEAYDELKYIMENGGELDKEMADDVAEAMKDWAVANGCTHYTHWFQPLTGVTAEKHDSFLSVSPDDGEMIISFSGKELIKGEPDASSFPSGGLRATFEARGYTVWDYTSPVFIRKDAAGATLCIPTAFCSYNGEALDQKTPLLRSMEALDRQGIRFLRLFGNRKSKKVIPAVGAEQEYFLVDAAKFLDRKDLVYTGHTLFGSAPPKGQELDDHYYGTIRQKIAHFMKEVNEELWKMGVPAKTQHNEVAPAQHELACLYEKANVAVDHNQIVMHTLRRVATANGMKCLLHEKPFEGVNGSGKHNNWSLMTDDGMNLLDPGRTPNENKQFLLVLSCLIRAVDKHAGLLRESAADYGNDERLGANEAPPTVISVYLGDQLEDVVRQIIDKGFASHLKGGGVLNADIKALPELKMDSTDRNRTSPFAFTGNKFEFRMVGSRDSIASANIVLNTIAAEAFSDVCDILENTNDFDGDVERITRENFRKHQRIIFDGNGYADSWLEEANKRGLVNLPDMVSAIPELTREETVEMFSKFGVFDRNELESRAEVKYEGYAKLVNIEARVMIDMTKKQIIPSVIRFTKTLAEDIVALKNCGLSDIPVQTELLERTNKLLIEVDSAVNKLIEVALASSVMEPGREQALYCRNEVVTAMKALRRPVDELEMIVDKNEWPMPSYGDLMFFVC